jgi:hypothetical protein
MQRLQLNKEGANMTNSKATPNANSMFYISKHGNIMWPEIERRVNSYDVMLEALKAVEAFWSLPYGSAQAVFNTKKSSS